jgi:lipopolysaccharide/colanic/teichoic acid biosynthesis glycosyltransferase
MLSILRIEFQFPNRMSVAPKYHHSSKTGRPLARSASTLGRILRSKTTLVLALELLWFAGSVVVLVRLSHVLTQVPPDLLLSLNELGVVTFTYVFAFYLMELYGLDMVATRRALVLNLVQALGLVCITIGLLERCFDGLSLPLKLVLFHAGLTAVFVIAARTAVDLLVSNRWPLLSVGFIGSSQAYAELEKEENLLRGLGFQIDLAGESLQQARRKLQDRTFRPRQLVIEEHCLSQLDTPGFLQECRQAKIEVEKSSSFRERVFGKLDPGPHLIDEFALSEGGPLLMLNRVLRRARDGALAGVGLMLVLPIMLIIAIAIKCDSPGPIFFLQDRVGKNGRWFKMLKFRSMYTADDRQGRLSHSPEWTTSRRDPRITRVGALMRGFHLDELPQLLNVLKGDMSIVGPRPFHPLHNVHLEKIPCFNLRLLVLPGITGWAQVRCDYSDSVEKGEEVLARDLYYVKHAGIVFDLMIIFETLRTCIWRRGAR